MEDVCLADFAAWYEKDTCKKAQKNFENEDEDEGSDVEMIENLPKQILYRRRGKAKTIRFPPFLKEIDPVNFYRSKVMLYHPWRDGAHRYVRPRSLQRTSLHNCCHACNL